MSYGASLGQASDRRHVARAFNTAPMCSTKRPASFDERPGCSRATRLDMYDHAEPRWVRGKSGMPVGS